jgi:DNA primase
MEHEQMTYPDALRYLAKKYGIKIEEQEQTAEEIAKMNERETLFHITNFANNFFQEQLHQTEEGRAIGLSYLQERGLRMDIIKKFQIGYSPESWDALTKNAIENGYKVEYLEKTGITIVKEDKQYDLFRARIIFPIFSIAGRAIAFGGRILDSTKQAAKYVNSPESEIYHKSNVLYGLNVGRSEIARQNLCYLCEGYMDVVALHQAGVENVVASSGTSLTTEQIRSIKRFTPNITILYDGDAAGIKASFRGIDMILEEGMNVRIVLFPEGEDPDSFSRKHTSEEVATFLKQQATDFITFKTGLLLSETNNDPIKKAELIREIIATIALIPENITRETYVKQCASLMQIEEATLIYSLNQTRRNIFKQKQKRQEQSEHPEHLESEIPSDILMPKWEEPLEKQTLDNRDIRERDVIRMLIVHGNKKFSCSFTDETGASQIQEVTVADFIINDLKNDEITFENKDYQYLFEYMTECRTQSQFPDEQTLLQHENKSMRSIVVDLLSNNYSISDGWVQRRIYTTTEEDKLQFACEHALLSLKGFLISKQLTEAETALQALPKEAADEQMNLLKHIMELSEIKKMIAIHLTRTRMPS